MKICCLFWSATGTYTKENRTTAYKQNGHPYKMIRRRNNVHSPLSERCGGSATVIYCSGCCSLSSVESKTLESYSYVECSEFIWNRTNSHALKRAHTAHHTKPNRWKLIHKYSVAVWVFISLTRIVLLMVCLANCLLNRLICSTNSLHWIVGFAVWTFTRMIK